MAQDNLLAAAEVVGRNPEGARRLGVVEEETSAWCEAAAAMVIPFDETLGVHEQSERFTSHQVWDFDGTRPDQYPLLLQFPYFDLYRKQVIKQADLVLAMHLRGDPFTVEQKKANFHYYESLTVRDSSLSACTQAVIASEVGHLGLAYGYLAEAALMDLDDLENNTRDGLHIASLAGSWIALVAGFGGLRERTDSLGFAPRLPQELDRLAFNVVFQGRHLHVEVRHKETTYRLTVGDDLTIFHFGRSTIVSLTTPVVCPTPPLPPGIFGTPAPRQPAGCAPLDRQPFQPRDGLVTLAVGVLTPRP